jgi:hypothetical protein
LIAVPIARAKPFFAQQNIVIPAQAGIQRLPVLKGSHKRRSAFCIRMKMDPRWSLRLGRAFRADPGAGMTNQESTLRAFAEASFARE